MRSNWPNTLKQVWQRKKEWLLTIIGLALGIPFITDGPPWLIVLIWVVTHPSLSTNGTQPTRAITPC